MNPIHIFPFYTYYSETNKFYPNSSILFLTLIVKLSSHQFLHIYGVSILQSFPPHNSLSVSLLPHKKTKFSANLFFLNIITVVIFDKGCKSNSSLRKFSTSCYVLQTKQKYFPRHPVLDDSQPILFS